MSFPISVYNDAGRITLTADLSEDTYEAYISLGYQMVDVIGDPHTQMVVDGALQNRPANPVTLSGTTLSNVPIPATVIINGTPYPTNEATVELGLTMGNYTVRVEAFPYLDKQFTVTV